MLSDVRLELEFRLTEAKATLALSDRYECPLEALVPPTGGIAYGQTFRGDAELASLKGLPTGKWAHAVICRLESGNYELVFYIL